MRRIDFPVSREPVNGACQRDTVAWIVSVFRFSDRGRVSATLLGRLVVLACRLRVSLSGVRRRTRDAPSHETIRQAFRSSLPEDPDALEARIDAGLARPLSRSVFKQPRKLAIDLHQRPYYGRRDGPTQRVSQPPTRPDPSTSKPSTLKPLTEDRDDLELLETAAPHPSFFR